MHFRTAPFWQVTLLSAFWVLSQIATGAWFKGTALGVLDADLNVLDWTWFLARPEDQVSLAQRREDHSDA